MKTYVTRPELVPTYRYNGTVVANKLWRLGIKWEQWWKQYWFCHLLKNITIYDYMFLYFKRYYLGLKILFLKKDTHGGLERAVKEGEDMD